MVGYDPKEDRGAYNGSKHADGHSSGAKRARERTSAQIMTMAPIRAENKASLPWDGPAAVRAKWGVIRPINPMMPAFDTSMATIREDKMTMKS